MFKRRKTGGATLKHVKKKSTRGNKVQRAFGIHESGAQILHDAMIRQGANIDGFDANMKYRKNTIGLDQSADQHNKRSRKSEAYRKHSNAQDKFVESHNIKVESADPTVKRLVNALNNAMNGITLDKGLRVKDIVTNVYNRLNQYGIEEMRQRLSAGDNRDFAQAVYDQFVANMEKMGFDIGHVTIKFSDPALKHQQEMRAAPNKGEEINHAIGQTSDIISKFMKDNAEDFRKVGKDSTRIKRAFKWLMFLALAMTISGGTVYGLTKQFSKEKEKEPVYVVGSK